MSAHEDFSRSIEIRGSSDRGFGVTLAAVFVVLSLFPLTQGRPIRVWGLAAACILCGLALLRPTWLRGLNRAWTRLGIVMGRVVTPVLLACVFYGVITPIGILMRLFGSRPLELDFDPGRKTYWVERRPAGPPPETMSRQF